MTATTSPPDTTPTRDFTVAVLVVLNGHILLHWHRKLGRWLPPGGHIEPNELPDEAAVRETLEETGIEICLVGERGLDRDRPDEPRQLIRPAGIQLEDISPGHQHIDLIYFAVPRSALADPYGLPAGVGWYDEPALASLPLTDEVRAWCFKALHALADTTASSPR